MFRARKHSVKRPILEDQTPRKRAKRCTPPPGAPASAALTSVERTPPAAVAKPVRALAVIEKTPLSETPSPPTYGAASTIQEPLPCATDCDVKVEECTAVQNEVAALEEKKTPSDTVDSATLESQVGETLATVDASEPEPEDTPESTPVHRRVSLISVEEDEDGYETANGDDIEWRKQCELTAAQRATRKSLWPPYEDTPPKSEEYVVVRPSRIIAPEHDDLLDSALALLP